MIKTVLIDVDDTILDFRECAGFSIESACKEYGIPYSATLKDTFVKVNDSLWQRVERGEITRDYLHDTRFDSIFSLLNISADGKAFEKTFRTYLNESSITVDGAKELLEYLSKKYFLAVASNAFYTQQINRLKKAGLLQYFNDIFVSSNVGADKPSKEFFDYCLSHSPAKNKSEVIMIGDSVTADITGGKRYGLTTCYLDRFNKTPDKNFMPDFTVKTLAEIKNIL